jgi:pre-rRNA-processing protein IPI3
VNALAIDPAERAIFATAALVIHQFNLIQSHSGKFDAVGGDPAHPLQAAESTQLDFIGHAAEITAVSLSFDATLLVSGDKSGEVFVWDVASRQVLRKVKGHNGTFPA